MCQPFVLIKVILTRHFYILQPIDTMADSSYSERLEIPVFLNLRSFSSARSVAQQSTDTARPYEEPLQWWATHREEFPILSKMALDLLSISLMSAECERVFSLAKNLITDRRNGLKEDIIQACTFLRHWFKEAGLI